MDVITLTGKFNNKNSLCMLVLESGAKARVKPRENDTSILYAWVKLFYKTKKKVFGYKPKREVT
jgi:hypothetical protein